MYRRILLAALVAVGVTIGLATPASASHPAQYVHNSMPTFCDYALIRAADHSSWFTDNVCAGGDSPRYATHFGVDHQARILYQSIATGTQYWSNCGENLPSPVGGIYYNGSPGAGGWQAFGNSSGVSIKLVKIVFYPTAPANVCDGVPDV